MTAVLNGRKKSTVVTSVKVKKEKKIVAACWVIHFGISFPAWQKKKLFQ